MIMCRFSRYDNLFAYCMYFHLWHVLGEAKCGLIFLFKCFMFPSLRNSIVAAHLLVTYLEGLYTTRWMVSLQWQRQSIFIHNYVKCGTLMSCLLYVLLANHSLHPFPLFIQRFADCIFPIRSSGLKFCSHHHHVEFTHFSCVNFFPSMFLWNWSTFFFVWVLLDHTNNIFLLICLWTTVIHFFNQMLSCLIVQNLA